MVNKKVLVRNLSQIRVSLIGRAHFLLKWVSQLQLLDSMCLRSEEGMLTRLLLLRTAKRISSVLATHTYTYIYI